MATAEEDVWCEVSDDEMYNPGKGETGTWEPNVEDIHIMFEQLKFKKMLELQWKCPGRRRPDSELKEVEEIKEEQVNVPFKQEEKRPTIPNEFDFNEEDFGGAKTVLTPRRTPGSAPKSQKKEAKMDKILKDLMQQRKLQAAEREARKLTGNKSPRAPTSPGRARIGSPAGSPRTPNRQSPVRIGSGPKDPITTTPVKPSLVDAQSALRKTKTTEPSTSTSLIDQKNTDTNMTASQKVQVSQTAANILIHQSQCVIPGETTSVQAVQREGTSSTQTINLALAKAGDDPKVGSTSSTTEVKESPTENMDRT